MRETVTEFLYFVKHECQKGCENCTFREEKATVEMNKRLCMFHYFYQLSDNSIKLAVSKYRKKCKGMMIR